MEAEHKAGTTGRSYPRRKAAKRMTKDRANQHARSIDGCGPERTTKG